ncbi:MAG TPA: peptidoglycan DD-metalloendopeptidase family protein [Actinomycetes bacterium]
MTWQVLPALALGVASAFGMASGTPHAVAQSGGWEWPLQPQPRVVAGFQAPPSPYAAGHRGADLAAGVGQPVLAAGGGVVAFAGPVAGRPVVSVVHPDGRRTTYEPVVARVAAGDRVSAGAVLGAVSAAPGHCLPATCLHWGLRLGETYLDPLALVGAAPVRLLPVWTDQAWPDGLWAQAGDLWARGPLLVADRLTAGRAGPRRGGGSRRGRCRPGRRGGRSRDPPRW